MRVMFNKRQADWVMKNVYPIMSFEEAVKFGSLMNRFHQGQYAVFFDISFLKKILELCIDRDLVRYPMFFELCDKYYLAIQRSEKNPQLYCIQFDTGDVSIKIPSIKGMRELFLNDLFRGLVGRYYPDGLKEVKEFVESGACIGPFPIDKIDKIRYMIGTGSYKVIPYKKTLTLI